MIMHENFVINKGCKVDALYGKGFGVIEFKETMEIRNELMKKQ